MKKRLLNLTLMIMMIFSIFSFLSIPNPVKASMSNLTPPEGGGSSGSETTCTDSTYYELNHFDPRISEDDVRRSDTFIMDEQNLEYYLKGNELNEENLFNGLKYEMRFYKVTVDCDADPKYSYDILGSDWDYYYRDMWFENVEEWTPGTLGKYKFRIWLDYKDTYYSTSFYLEFSEEDEILDLTGPTEHTVYVTEKLDVEEFASNLIYSASTSNVDLYVDFDSYTPNYQTAGTYYIYYVLKNMDTYDAVGHQVKINVIDNSAPTFSSDISSIIVSNKVVISPNFLYPFLGIEDIGDSKENIKVQVVSNTYEHSPLVVGTYEFVLKAIDSSNNVSDSKKIEIFVVDDLLIPLVISNDNHVFSNTYLEADSLAYAVAYTRGFSSKEYSYKLDNEDYRLTQYESGIVERGSEVQVEYKFNDNSTEIYSAVFKTVDSKYITNNGSAEEYNSDKNKFLRFLEMLLEMLLWLLEKLFGWLI